jgi:hypothetical protein
VLVAAQRGLQGADGQRGHGGEERFILTAELLQRARETARRSSASSPTVELTNTRKRRSGVRITSVSVITARAVSSKNAKIIHLIALTAAFWRPPGEAVA